MTDEPPTPGEPATTPTERPLPAKTAELSLPAPTAAPPPRDTPAGTPPPPPAGTPVRDTLRNRVGVVMDHQGPHIQLRPLDGGREWDADPHRIVPVGPIEVLRARVAEANHRSRRGRPG